MHEPSFTPNSFEDWSDMNLDNETDNDPLSDILFEQRIASEEIREQTRAKNEQEIAHRLSSAEIRIQDALMKEGGPFFLKETNALREATVRKMRDIDPELRAVNEIYLVFLEIDNGTQLTAYKPTHGEQARFDPHNEEPRAQKEWLGYVLDRVLSVGRSPIAVVRSDGLPRGIGSLTEWRHGTNTALIKDWVEMVRPDEIQRVADYHYLIGETDGRNGQFILEQDGRLTTIDRGESFLVNKATAFYSEVIAASLEKKLGGHPDVLRAAHSLIKSDALQSALENAFLVVFGTAEGVERYASFRARLDAYLEHAGIPESISLTRRVPAPIPPSSSDNFRSDIG